ncbi:MAG: CRISPR-associated endoribonuclease Cas6 [Daejeonella sp.]
MRLYLKLTKNTETIPFNYQDLLTGVLHKWIGDSNKEHGSPSLYSFSWFQNVKSTKKGIELTSESFFFISTHEEALAKKIIKGILKDPEVCYGSEVVDVQILNTPHFENRKRFFLGSPAFIKRRTEDRENHILYNDGQSGKFLTETLQKKLELANLPIEGVKIQFDKEYPNPQTKVISYKKIQNRVNICPVIIEGSPEQIAFAWNVGVGNSTGIGFGSLK